MDNQDLDREIREIQKEYLDFLDDEEDQGKYSGLVKSMLDDKRTRLIVNVNDLRRKCPNRVNGLLSNCFQEQVAFQRALKDYLSALPEFEFKTKHDYFIGFEGSFGSKHVTPRTLNTKFLGSLVCIEGIVTKCTLVHPKVVGSVHYCPATTKVIERKYSDLTSLEAFPSSSVYPTKDEDGNLLETEFGLSVYRDHQTVSIQEMPEKAPAGQLPRSIDIICDDDLVDLCKPGDRIQVVGSYRCLPNKQGYFTSGAFRTIIIANNIQQLNKEANDPDITRQDVAKCRQLSKRHNVFELLAKSLAPSIHGHEYIKKAILCLLLGGVEKNLPNGTRLRGDINILLVGDPSVAKSQLLRYVLQTAPRAVTTTGRGSSGVGLTAAVTTDQETGEKRLEAGAMVLADRGVVCIDEFDKMTDIDRTAIHEVMEQGRVTIAKAGIHTSLNARCSVLAAANPVYGKYDQYKTPMENIGLQDSLLSRFDLLFVMLDTVDEDQDNIIADHVVRMHRYRNPQEQDGEVLPMSANVDFQSTYNLDAATDEAKETEIYEKYNPLLHGSHRKKSDKYLSVDFMKKYIRFVKIIKPVLTKEACDIIVTEYSKLRSEELLEADIARTTPVTARTLETLIRLATAHARARMSRDVTEEDAHAAIELVQFAYFKKVLEKEKRKRRREEEAPGSSDDEDDDFRPKRSKTTPATRSRSQEDAKSVDDHEPEDERARPEVSVEINGDVTVTQPQEDKEQSSESMEVDTTISDERLRTFRESLFQMFKVNMTQSLTLASIRDCINVSNTTAPFTQTEVTNAIERMTEDNQVMLADDIVILI